MSEIKCRFGYTEKSCIEKDFPPCGDSKCELPDRPIPKEYLHRFRK